MKVSKASNGGVGVGVVIGGAFYTLTGKFALLCAGGAVLIGKDGSVGTKITIPNYGDIPRGVTDAVLVALARRGFSGGNILQPDGKFVTDMDIPTYEEALEELRSGKDKYGGDWPVPILQDVPFEFEE